MIEELKTPEPKPEKKPNIFVRLLAFLLTVALMLGAVAAVAYRDKINFDALKRYFTYRSLERSDTGQTESFPYDVGAKGGFLGVGEDLLCYSTSGARLYSGGGVPYAAESVVLTKPVADADGGSAVVYDAGGYALRVLSRKGLSMSINMSQGHEIISARMAKNGYVAVTAKEPGFKGAVTFYDTDSKPVVSYRMSSRFVTDGLLSDDGRTAALVTVGQQNGLFDTTVALYALDSGDEPFASCSIGNDAILDVATEGLNFRLLGQNGLYVVSTSGALAPKFDFTGQFIKDYALKGGGFSALLLGKYRAGGATTLVSVGDDGAVLGTLELADQVLSLDAAGRYIAVLTAGRLDIYTKDLSLYSTLQNTDGARSVVMREDGTAYLIGGETARLYIPG